MNKTSKFLTVASILAISIAMNTGDADAKKGKNEKCFGVVKAGQNDCGAADGSHSCAAQAETDDDPNEWVFVPKGTCNKLAGGSTEPKS